MILVKIINVKTMANAKKICTHIYVIVLKVLMVIIAKIKKVMGKYELILILLFFSKFSII
jgi:hypothetical protein